MLWKAPVLLCALALVAGNSAADDSLLLPVRKGGHTNEKIEGAPDSGSSKSQSQSSSGDNPGTKKSSESSSRSPASRSKTSDSPSPLIAEKSSDSKSSKSKKFAEDSENKSSEKKSSENSGSAKARVVVAGKSSPQEESPRPTPVVSTSRTSSSDLSKAAKAKSFLSRFRKQGPVFNTDYRTRKPGEPIPSQMEGSGINGRSLPLGGEDSIRLSGSMPLDYMPTDLVLIPPELSFERQPVYLRQEAANSLIRMFNDAAARGLTLRVVSAYRDIDHQRRLYSGRGKVAKPGKSEHMLGTTMDLTSTHEYLLKRSFANTPEGCWLFANAARYGWKHTVYTGGRSETDEPWHLRYYGSALDCRSPSSSNSSNTKPGLVGKATKAVGRLFGKK